MSKETMTPAQEEMDDDLVILEDENGDEVRFTFLQIVKTDGKSYAILLPIDDEEGGVVIVEIVDLGLDTEHYDAVTDEALLTRIFDQFRTEYADLYSFED
ncbi:MAG: DUF1292 domain-containing protein [Oscillospiraceae bacterium]|nr:DUF1292 domain-containing protein [Oscillospiraceae bacterium]